jgi:hypothetical protein
MVKHIIFWTLKPEKKAEAAQIAKELNAKFKGLLGVVDGLTEIEAGHNYSGGAYDLALNCTFTTKEAEKGYQTHPSHLAIKGTVQALVCARECIDYEI